MRYGACFESIIVIKDIFSYMFDLSKVNSLKLQYNGCGLDLIDGFNLPFTTQIKECPDKERF